MSVEMKNIDTAVAQLEHSLLCARAWLADERATAQFSPAEVYAWKSALLQQVEAADYNLRHALSPLFRVIAGYVE